MKIIFNVLAKIFYHNEYKTLKGKLIKLNKQICTINHANLENTVTLLILGEDHRFYRHIGFDIIGIIRAFKNNLYKNKFEGASTIEQQLVRVLINDYRKSYTRKTKEIFLSTVVQNFIIKKNIPIGYLLIAHFGSNLDGINSILKKFQITIDQKINLEISAEIVARIKYPETQTPRPTQLKKIENRKKYLLNKFKKQNEKKF